MQNSTHPTRTRSKKTKNTSKTVWTEDEDQKLTRLVKNSNGFSWTAFSQFFPGKTPPQIAGRWEKVLDPSLIKGSWTEDEDRIIMNFVKTQGDRDWARLAELLPGRIGKQCRERWKNHLNPNVIKNPWTEDEDNLLVRLHQQFGNSWTKITQFFPGRTDNCVKNRWNSTIKRRLERAQQGLPLSLKRGRKPKKDHCLSAPEGVFSSSNDDSRCSSAPSGYSSTCPSPLRERRFVEFIPLQQGLPLLIRRRPVLQEVSCLTKERQNLSLLLRESK